MHNQRKINQQNLSRRSASQCLTVDHTYARSSCDITQLRLRVRGGNLRLHWQYAVAHDLLSVLTTESS